MKRYTIFYAGKFYGELDEWSGTRGLPNGAYVMFRGTGEFVQWFVIEQGTIAYLLDEDVPKELQLWVLLLT